MFAVGARATRLLDAGSRAGVAGRLNMRASRKKAIVVTLGSLVLAGVLSAGFAYRSFSKQASLDDATETDVVHDELASDSVLLKPDSTLATPDSDRTSAKTIAADESMAFIESRSDSGDSRVDFEMMNPSLTLEAEPGQLVAQVAEVDWVAAQNHPTLEAERLPQQQRDLLSPAAIPVLLPADDRLRDSGEVTAGELWYSSSMATADDRVYVTVHGQLKTLTQPGSQTEVAAVTGFPQQIDDSMVDSVEGGLEARFRAFGAHYSVTVECFDWRTDPHCRDTGFILQVVESLLTAGGKEQQEP